MALSHHDAAKRDQRCGRKTELFGTQQRRDHDIAAGLQAAIGLQHNAAAQIVQHQDLMRFGDAQFPWQSSMLDAGQWRSTGSARVTGDQNVVRMRFGDARCDHADADFADQFDADPRRAVGVLQVVDQLGQILNRIDVVVRRWADQADTRRAVADPRNVLVDFRPAVRHPRPAWHLARF